MPQFSRSAQPSDREKARARMSEFFLRGDGPWREEALLSFRAFHTRGGDRVFPPAPASVKYAESLFRRLEEASAHVGCELRGFRKPGIYFIPGQEMVRTTTPVGFILVSGNGFSPFVIGPDELLLQKGRAPAVYKYDIRTDLAPVFAGAITPESFF